ncbi:MAG: hypothetical protein GVY13_08020 [Alphaproteobacteria bacterium]|jgi:hypothetical protein|nr:hypothetical protein [Alphaproteobacteria bacterium]
MNAALQSQPLRSLILIAERRAPLELNGLATDEQGQLVIRSPVPAFQFRFRYEDHDYAVDVLPGAAGGFACRMTAMAGRIPFSVEDASARLSLRSLIRATVTDRPVSYRPGTQESLWVVGEAVSDDAPTPDAVFFETVKLVGAMRSYLSLAASYVLKHPGPRLSAPGSSGKG